MYKPTVVFYHRSDLDGKCSGELWRRKFPDSEMIGIDYGDEFPWMKIVDRDVVMADFALQPFDNMIRLAKLAKTFLWIDHHKSAIDDYDKNEKEFDPNKFERCLSIGTAACELCWDALQVDAMPTFVRLLGRYDVWDLEYDRDVLPFQYGMRQYDASPGDLIWDHLFESPSRVLDKTIVEGKAILAYEKQVNTFRMGRSFEALSGPNNDWKVLALNTSMPCGSQTFESKWDPEKHHAMVGFQMLSNGRWTVSMYTTRDDVDVGSFCKSQGGGGHRKAAGFQSDKLPVYVSGKTIDLPFAIAASDK